MNPLLDPEAMLHRLSLRGCPPPAAEIRRQLFPPAPPSTENAGTRHPRGLAVGLTAWLMPIGAAVVAILGWTIAPGFPLQVAASETNTAFRSMALGIAVGSVNSIPACRLTSTLSNVIPSTNVSFHGWN